MEGLNLAERLGRVEAPPGFERRVMVRLAERKQKRIRTRRLGLSLSGAVGAAAIILIAVNLFLIPQRNGLNLSGLEGAIPDDFRMDSPAGDLLIPITERVDYAGELRSLRSEPPTIYILEQISNSTDTKIKY